MNVKHVCAGCSASVIRVSPVETRSRNADVFFVFLSLGREVVTVGCLNEICEDVGGYCGCVCEDYSLSGCDAIYICRWIPPEVIFSVK
jgi:hypothetical protein